ncbi:MAG: metallophosphoesterase family protein [Longimicrobiales bacterium]
MKLLHTADWHVGRTIRGRSRADEHRAVLDEIIAIAREEVVDLVVVAGDLFDVSAPAPESEAIVYRALLGLASTGTDDVLIAGNHDHPRRLAAVRPLLDLTRVRTAAHIARPDDGGVADIRTRTGAKVRVAMLPFVSQRAIVRADALMAQDAGDHVLAYVDRYRRITSMLCEGFDAGCINIVVAHATVFGARLGGGEREAHTIDDYHVTANVFPSTAHYVALGHVHHTQRIHGACPVWYSGSPLQLDFGEGANEPRVLLVEMDADVPARVREIPLTSGRRLLTARGSLAELEARADDFGEDYLRIVLTDAARSDLADAARAALPNAVDVLIARDDEAADAGAAWTIDQVRRSPVELFSKFLAERDFNDPALTGLFAELLAADADHD